MAYLNGQLPATELATLIGNPGMRMRRDAAAAFGALYAVRPLRVRDAYRILGAPGDYARGVWSQWACWERYKYHGGPLAAVPGYSNHGWGLAIDVWSCATDRAVIDSVGAHFGFSKTWSDAQSECWHILYKPGVWSPPVARAWQEWVSTGGRTLDQFADEVAGCEVSTLLRQTAKHYTWFNDELARYLNDWADGKISAHTTKLYAGARFWVYR